MSIFRIYPDKENTIASGTNYELLNRGNIKHGFSFFEDRLYIGTGYELIQYREKEREEENEGEDTEEIAKEDIIDTWKHHVNFNITGYPVNWFTPEYKAFWGDIKTDFSENRLVS